MPQFQCGGTAKRLPTATVGNGRLVIRVNDAAATAKIYFKVDRGTVVTAGNADGFLNAGEALEVCGDTITNASDVSVIDSSDNPIVFWGIL